MPMQYKDEKKPKLVLCIFALGMIVLILGIDAILTR